MEFAHRLVSTRRGTLFVALLAALLAGVTVVAYLNQYRNSLKAQGALVTVLVARDMIPKGTSGNVLATKSLYTATTIRESQLREGAISDPASLRGTVATREVFEGAQLTSADFVAAGDSIAATLSDRERVVSVPLDAAHGLIGEIEAGNRVDVYAGFNVIPVDGAGRPVNGGQARPMLRLIMSDVPVLAVGESPDVRVGLDERHAGGRRREGGSARVRVRQRKDLARAQAEHGGRRVAARARHRRDHVAGCFAREGAAVGGRQQVSVQKLRVFVALEDSLDSETLREALPAGTPVRLVSLDEARDHTTVGLQEAADLVIVGCADERELALQLIAAAAKQRNDRPVVALYSGSPNGFLERAFEAGADDLITLPQTAAQLSFALEKALARRRGNVPSRGVGEMVTVLGPKGGTGKTLTSCNVVVALALDGVSAVIVDLDLQFGDVGLALGLRPVRTIYDLAVSGGSLDGDKIDGFLADHPSGARALLAPLRPDQAAAVSVTFLRDVFDILRARYDVVVVDTPPAFTPEVIAAVDASSQLCVVGMLDALSLKDTKIGLETLAQMGYESEDVTLILNRADTSVGISEADVEQLLGRRPDVLVPSDRAIPRAITDGQPIVVAEPRSNAARAFTTLARHYAAAPIEIVANGSPNGAASGARRGVLRRKRS